MTDIETALNTPVDFAEPYMGRAVSATSVKITNSGDGLSKQLGIAPQVFEPEQRVMVLLECEAGPHTHKLIDKANTWELIQTLKAETATIVDDRASASKLRKAADRVAKVEEQKKGTQRLDGTDASDLEGGDPDEAPPSPPDPEWDDGDGDG